MNILVGKNSKIYNQILNSSSFSCLAVSTNEIFSIDLSIYTKIFIFSYKPNISENEMLFKYISNYKNLSTVLISSVAVLSTQKTLFYKYPKIKFYQEYFAIKYCLNFNIIRLGRFIGGEPIKHPDLITTSDMLISALMQPVKNEIIDAFVVNEYKLSRLNKLYIKICKYNSIRLIVRIIDFFLKKSRYKFYGYTALTYSLYV